MTTTTPNSAAEMWQKAMENCPRGTSAWDNLVATIEADSTAKYSGNDETALRFADDSVLTFLGATTKASMLEAYVEMDIYEDMIRCFWPDVMVSPRFSWLARRRAVIREKSRQENMAHNGKKTLN
jgi:hypothetical protein